MYQSFRNNSKFWPIHNSPMWLLLFTSPIILQVTTWLELRVDMLTSWQQIVCKMTHIQCDMAFCWMHIHNFGACHRHEFRVSNRFMCYNNGHQFYIFFLLFGFVIKILAKIVIPKTDRKSWIILSYANFPGISKRKLIFFCMQWNSPGMILKCFGRCMDIFSK